MVRIAVDHMTNWELIDHLTKAIHDLENENLAEHDPAQREVLLNLDGDIEEARAELRWIAAMYEQHGGDVNLDLLRQAKNEQPERQPFCMTCQKRHPVGQHS